MSSSDEIRGLEQQWMLLKDEYAELARAVGANGDAWFNDPLESHQDIVKMALNIRLAERQNLARKARGLSICSGAALEEYHCELPEWLLNGGNKPND